MLTKEEAQALVVARLRSRCGSRELSIAAWGDSEPAFGWVFEASLTGEFAALSAPAVPRWLIVNKISHQVVASAVDYDVEEFVRRYEKLLAQNQTHSQQWCGTSQRSFPWSLWRKRTVAERAKDGGFYEIGVKEGEP